MPIVKPFVALYLLPVVLMSTVSATGQTQARPEVPKAADGTASPKAAEGIGQAVDPNKYVLGPEDVIFIRTWREPDFTLAVALRPDGKITVPLVGDVPAAGLTPLALTADLKTRLSQYINNPDVTIFVQEVRSKKYFIDGQVNRPGVFPLVTPTRVLEALSICGGFREFADEKHIRILRGSQTFKFNYKDVSNGRHREEDIYIENGDHIIVR